MQSGKHPSSDTQREALPHCAPTREMRTIKSFVKREGRLTLGQERALSELWPQVGLMLCTQPLDFTALFGRQAPVIVEIGFGMGQSLITMAEEHPENDYIGIEVHRPGVGSLLMGIREHGLRNIRVYQHDAVEILQKAIPDHSLTGVQLFFPDPWPKTRHHKRRIVQPAFVALIAQKLKPHGWFHAATDWQPYAEHMLEVLEHEPQFHNTAGPNAFAERGDRPITKFERRGERLGHGVWDLRFASSPPAA